MVFDLFKHQFPHVENRNNICLTNTDEKEGRWYMLRHILNHQVVLLCLWGGKEEKEEDRDRNSEACLGEIQYFFLGFFLWKVSGLD